MLIELKRCNSIGNVDGILFLISMIAGKDKISQSEIRNRCALENGITLNCPGAIAFLHYLGYVDVDDSSVVPNDSMNVFSAEKVDVIKILIKRCMECLVKEGIFDAGTIGFDSEKGRLSIKRSAFPLTHAAIRNFLTTAGALEKEEHGEICLTDYYESDFTAQLRSRKKRFTLEELIQKQEEQSMRGLEAEEFVLEIERNRLPLKAGKIKRISDIDVSAGYDIVSFSKAESESYDRFIEVKCYIGQPHFYWSENEVDVAKIKGEKYILCLVGYSRILEPGYKPKYISDPYRVIFDDESWMVNTASYRIQKI